MSCGFKYIYIFIIYFLCGCISVKDINKTYQKGMEAREKLYNEDEEFLPLLSFGTEKENEDERIKVEKFINKTIDSLSIPLNNLIIIKNSWGPQSESYYFFPENSNSIYFFINTIFITDTLEVYEEPRISFSNERVQIIYDYFNSGDYKSKMLNIDFCTNYSNLYLTVLKVENMKTKLFYIDSMDMCKNNNNFKILKGSRVVPWKFSE